MKKKLLIVILTICLVLTGTLAVYAAAPSEPKIELNSTWLPRDIYNFLEEDNPYYVDGYSESATMYSAYSFTGAHTYLITLTNHQDQKQTIKLYRTSDDKKLDEFTIPANSTTTFIFECTNVWYMAIYSPCDGISITGTIYASPV